MKKERLMKNVKNIFAAAAVCVALFSCATSKDAFVPIDKAVSANDFATAMAVIDNAEKPLYQDNDAVSKALDKGVLEHYGEQWNPSTQELGEADRLIQEAQTKSVTAEIASFIANDNTKEYAGEDYENIYLNVFNALSYYHDGKLEDAIVEIRNLTDSSGKLAVLKAKYEGKGLADKLKEALDPVAKLGVSIPSLDFAAQIDYSDSALAHYVSALFFRAAGKEDDARIEFDAIVAAFASSASVYTGAVPASINDEKQIPSGKARLNVIGFTGLAPIKVAQSVPILLTEGTIIKAAVEGEKQDKNAVYLLPTQASALQAAVAVTGPLFAILHSIYIPLSPLRLQKSTT
jgi:hypothetical protein